MKLTLKSRFICFLVIIALGVIFVPFLFSPYKHTLLSENSISDIPSPPALPNIRKIITADAAGEMDSNQLAIARGKGLSPQAWVVQLASFVDRNKAKKLEVDLRKAGYRAYTQTTATQKGQFINVFIGPEISREQAEQIRQELEKQGHNAGVVISFNPK